MVYVDDEVIKVEHGSLGIDKVFDGDELIIDLDSTSMKTVRHDEGAVGGDGEDYEIRVFYYDITGTSNFTFVTNNGYSEVSIHSEEHDKYKQKLESKGIW